MREIEYLVIFEKAEHNWAAYAPDVPGCVSTGRTKEETAANFRTALALHFEGLQEDGLPIPEPTSESERLRIAV